MKNSVLIFAAFAVLALRPMPTGSTDEYEFQPLCNGRDLSGWSGLAGVWSVQDGVISGRTGAANPIKENTFLVWQGGRPANFELRADFRLVAENDKKLANSGIYYRSRFDTASQQVLGYQGDMDAELPEYLGALYEDERTTIARCGERVHARRENGKPKLEVTGATASGADCASNFAELAAGHWLRYDIVAKGRRLQHFVDGKLTVEVIDDDESAAKSGVIALQVHHGAPMLVQFKNVQLKLLP